MSLPIINTDLVEFLGMTVEISKIENPHLKRVVAAKTNSGYKFGYNDHSKSSGHYGDYGDYENSYSDHREKYHEYSVYADNIPGYTDYGDNSPP